MGETAEILVKSSLDGSEEPSIFYRGSGRQAPLIVSLHSWSSGRHNHVDRIASMAEKLGCGAVFPEFRGPNLASNPRAGQACASKLAVRDVIDAVEKLIGSGAADPGAIFLVGGSGGAHMALMTAAHRPELWKAVIASCPITDLLSWHGENPGYARHIEACCGGPPVTARTREEYRRRSPLRHARGISRSRTYILHGKNDASVPFTHSTKLFSKICAVSPGAEVYLEIFNGGHEHRLDRAEEIIRTSFSSESPGPEITG